MRGALACAVALAVSATAVPAQITVVGHTLAPVHPIAGVPAEERLVVRAPAGVRVTVSDAGPPGDGVERMGRWRGTREEEGATITWTFAAPLAAWREGERTGPLLRVSVGTADGDTAPGLTVAGVTFHARAPEPAGYAPGGPAPPEGAPPNPGGKGNPGLALVVLATVAWAGWGVLGFRTSRPRLTPQTRAAEAGPSAGEEPHAPVDPWAPLEAARLEADPGGAALALAHAVRAHPRLAACGVTPASTTPEALRAGAPAGVEPVLRLADAVKYGAYRPTRAEVASVAGSARRALEAERTGRGVTDA